MERDQEERNGGWYGGTLPRSGRRHIDEVGVGKGTRDREREQLYCSGRREKSTGKRWMRSGRSRKKGYCHSRSP